MKLFNLLPALAFTNLLGHVRAQSPDANDDISTPSATPPPASSPNPEIASTPTQPPPNASGSTCNSTATVTIFTATTTLISSTKLPSPFNITTWEDTGYREGYEAGWWTSARGGDYKENVTYSVPLEQNRYGYTDRYQNYHDGYWEGYDQGWNVARQGKPLGYGFVMPDSSKVTAGAAEASPAGDLVVVAVGLVLLGMLLV